MSVIDVPVAHTEKAFRQLEALRTMQGTIDGFVMPPTPMDSRSRPRGHSLYPTEFFVALAVALESSPQLVAALQAAGIQLTAADIRDMLRFGEAYLPVADEHERIARAIRHTVALRRAKVGRVAASAYRVIQAMNLLEDASIPIPEMDTMRRAFPASRRRKPAEPVDPAVKAKASP